MDRQAALLNCQLRWVSGAMPSLGTITGHAASHEHVAVLAGWSRFALKTAQNRSPPISPFINLELTVQDLKWLAAFQ
jgi:hypothetical protein